MTLEEFEKKRFTGYEIIECYPKGLEERDWMVECMLLAVDFEQKLFRLQPFGDNPIYEEKPFWARVEYCKRPSPKLRVSKNERREHKD